MEPRLDVPFAPSAMAEADGTTGIFRNANAAFCELVGYTEAELRRISVFTLTHPGDLARTRELFVGLASGASGELNYEKRFVRKDGATVWAHVFHVKRPHEDGRGFAVLGVMQDITTRRVAEEALVHSQQRLRMALTASCTGTFRWDLDTHVVDLDESFCRLAGLGEEPRTCSVRDLYALAHRDDAAEASHLMSHVTLSGGTFELKHRIVRADTRAVRWVSSRGQVVKDDSGGRSLYAAVVDITHSVRQEDELRDREEQLRLAIEAADVGTWDYDLATRELRFSEQCSRFFEIPSDETLTLTLARQRVHPDDRERVEQLMLRAMRPSIGGSAVEFRVLNPVTGVERWLVCNGRVVHDQGMANRLTGIVADITERKYRDAALMQHSALLQERADLLDLSPDAILVRDLSGHVIYWNHGGEDLYGIPRFDAVGRCAAQLLQSRFPIPLADIEAIVLTSGRWQGEVVQTRRDGTTLTVASRWALQRDKLGAPSRILELHTDITERKAVEEALNQARIAAEDASLAKTRFLANMSHEIRTPLGVIKGFSELLLDDDRDEGNRRTWLGRIHRNSMHLASLVDEILDLSKIEADRLEIEAAELSIADLTQDLEDTLNPAAAAKGLSLRFVKNEPPPATFQTDPLRLKQILLNVIGNAIKFTDKGHVEVATRLSPQTGLLEFTITDTGIGIAPEERETLFQPFMQADSSLTRRFGGTGLGLCISKRLATMLGGDLVLQSSRPGTGSCFVLTLRAIAGVAPTLGASEPSRTVSGAMRLQGLRVLLVDAGQDSRMLMMYLLRCAGAEVEPAVTVEQGEERARRGGFDAILMDLQMPDVDGFLAAARLRAAGCSTPIIAMASQPLKGERERCLNAGFAEHLTKPVEQRALVSTLARLARRRLTILGPALAGGDALLTSLH